MLYFYLILTIVQKQVLVSMMPLMKLTLETIYLKPTLPKTLNQQDYLGVYIKEYFSRVHEKEKIFNLLFFKVIYSFSIIFLGF